MKNYYDKQKTNTKNQIEHFYETLDTSFRGFRHGGGKADGSISADDSFRKLKNNKNGDKLVNWENTLNKDAVGARFSGAQNNFSNGNKSLDSYEIYVKSKKIKEEKKSKLVSRT